MKDIKNPDMKFYEKTGIIFQFTTCALAIMKRTRGNILWVCFFIFLISGCSNIKYLPEGEELYTGADLEVNSDEKIHDKSDLKEELENRITPPPNETFLGILQPRLWFYNVAGEPERKGFRYWLKNKLGRPPVFFSAVSPKTTAELLQDELYNRGYFNAEVNYNIKRKNKKATVEYIADIHRPYTINEIFFPGRDTEIDKQIKQSQENSILIKGEIYSLQKLIEERERIDNEVKDNGFFYFSPDFLLFRVDSTIGQRQVNIYLTVKPDAPPPALKVYEINDIYINADYSEEKRHQDTILYNGYYYISSYNLFNPKVITGSVFLEKGQKYSLEKHDLTLNRLMGLGVFKFVNIRFREVDTTNTGLLNAYIFLTPLRKISLRLELRAVTKSNNFAGPGFSASLRNRNLLKGAELYVINLQSSYETQISGQQSGLNSYDLGLENELFVPRFITPFKITNISSRFVPKTRINLGYQLLNRVQYFRLNSFRFSYGYTWNEIATKKHEYNPFAINFVQVGQTTPIFQAILENNPILRRSFEKQLIMGSTYSYTYNNQIEQERRNHTYFRGNIDIAGNAIAFAQSLAYKEKPTTENPYKILGLAYSQYVKFDIDFRYYLNLSDKNSLVRRVLVGIGIPYGNSTTLPYVKQFYIGGTNSLRSFRTRSLGPGTYHPDNSETSNLFIDQTGDIKLETNMEYRFDITNMFKGALFTDAGNIWQLYENVNTPGGKFEWKTFYQEIAVGFGAGLRIDISFFVLRFDLAFPLRKPYFQYGDRWVVDKINFGSPTWRKENLVLNIAIGYPF